MRRLIGECLVELTIGDITHQQVDAIVNAANSALSDGAGVNGAIQRAAGPAVLQETNQRYPEGCPTGGAVVSGAGDLPVKYLFHAVGPIWTGGRQGESELLQSAYRRCLELAIEHDCESIAFPAISTSIYGYPLDRAAETALATVVEFLSEHERPRLVRFVLFSAGVHGAFARLLEELAAE